MAKVAERTKATAGGTKLRILEAAEEIFAEKGFEGASTREIAAKAGVNISSLHYHWESKETLYFAVFQNIYGRLTEISRASVVPGALDGPGSIHEKAIGRTFDFFVENPNVPRLLVRRILENEEFGEEIERDILEPAWRVFGSWVEEYSGKKIRDLDAKILMLTLNNALLLFVLDSRQYSRILGGSVTDARIGRRLRQQLIALSELLVRS